MIVKSKSMTLIPSRILAKMLERNLSPSCKASAVCFCDGKPHKDHYRHYRIKTVEGSDDFASMAEVVGRRYARVQVE